MLGVIKETDMEKYAPTSFIYLLDQVGVSFPKELPELFVDKIKKGYRKHITLHSR